MDVYRRLGLNVKRLRKEAGFTQEAFADAAGIARSYMSDVERGARNPTIKVIDRIAAVLAVSPARLLDDPTSLSTGPDQVEPAS